MRVKAIALRILQQLIHDKRTIGMMICAPILVLTLMSFIFLGTDYHPKIGIVSAPLAFVTALENKDAVVTRLDAAQADALLAASQLDATVEYQSGKPYVYLEGSDPTKSAAVLSLVQSAMQPHQVIPKPDVTYVYGYKNMSSFDNFGPILIGFFVFFFVFLIAGVSFLSERTTGTLEKLLSTPVRRWEIVAGYLCGFAVFTFLQSALIAWYSISVLHVMMLGSYFAVLLVTMLTAMTGLTIGMFLSAYAENELQMIQFIPLVITPQVFFSGLFDLSTMADWMQRLGHLMPLWYIADALRGIMVRGKSLVDVLPDIGVLLAICAFFIVANILVLKKYRRI